MKFISHLHKPPSSAFEFYLAQVVFEKIESAVFPFREADFPKKLLPLQKFKAAQMLDKFFDQLESDDEGETDSVESFVRDISKLKGQELVDTVVRVAPVIDEELDTSTEESTAESVEELVIELLNEFGKENVEGYSALSLFAQNALATFVFIIMQTAGGRDAYLSSICEEAKPEEAPAP